ncbi:phytoene desaturase [Dulcicalothrix desertica PCC 7102]|uniref:Phytoene dehydrogenase n=1 Tax=Dulcicalothrix desertica PCC 7102 TaxID=232991 RepID=A0A433UKK0_9CYAN|nr:phytoene desaturase family protein [Dulcicalothrix desertica]RUS94383.1 phytoene desaturase [Dulcicalothrix desertica PCC 7102]TWH54990.1 phytoene desaturase [Dulcicalothrix desertica PCC 7102]
MKIVIIGSGFGGLSAAIRLQTQGHQVTLLEKQSEPGGRANVYQQDGFTFDAGPTIITAPYLIDELFQINGRRIEDYVQLVQLDPFYNIRFSDGSVFHLTGNREYILQQIREFNSQDIQGYYRFEQALEKIFKKVMPLMEQPLNNFCELIKFAPKIIGLQPLQSVASFVNQYFQDERLRQVFSFHPLWIGSNPFTTSSIFTTIHELERKFGVWFAMGGTGALVNALVQLFCELGGKLLLNTPVAEIAMNYKTGYATGAILANGKYLPSDIVVSNADVAFTYMNLVPAKFRRHYSLAKFERMRHSMSVFVIYFGTNRRYQHMAHHEMLMAPEYHNFMQDIFERKHLPSYFCLYLHRPTATDASLAPLGCESWYALVPVPNLSGQTDWEVNSKPFRNKVIQYLERYYLPDLSKHIVTEHSINPLYFRDTFNSYQGSAFAMESTFTQSGWFRPHHQSEDIRNLYFVGAGTHPGAGLPSVITSGKIVARMIGKA